MKRELTTLLQPRYIVFHKRDAVFDAFQFALLLERTTDIGHNMDVRNDTFRASETYRCRSRRRLDKLT